MKYNLLCFLCCLSIGCTKESKCKDLIQFPCYDYNGHGEVSAIEGTYGCEDVCIYQGIDTYFCKAGRTGISVSDATGGNLMGSGYYGTISFRSDYYSYDNPILKINTPIIAPENADKLTVNEQINERIQHFNSRENWKLGNRLTNNNDGYLSISLSFDCSERTAGLSQYQLSFDSHDELLDSESFVKVLNFEMEKVDGEIHYDITFDIDTYLYDPNCIRNCRREEFKVEWRAIFSVPEK
jgi:hypothetical protein